MTSFVFSKTFLCALGLELDMFKTVFGQTSIRASVLDPAH